MTGSTALLTQETPIGVRSRGLDHFAILTRPAAEPNGAVALLLWGGGHLPSFGRNGVRTRLARRLADAGYHAVRNDYPGLGDSTGTPPDLRLDAAAVAPLVEDTLALVSRLGESGLSRFVMIGSCLGTRLALTAAERIPDVAGMVLLAAPPADYEYQRMRPVSGPTNEFVRLLSSAVERRVPLLLVYGERDVFYRDFVQASTGQLGELLERAGDLVSTVVVPGTVHADPTVATQQETLAATLAWLTDRRVR
jgi:pimeloyl-ACP methyl ester carboxylesterase